MPIRAALWAGVARATGSAHLPGDAAHGHGPARPEGGRQGFPTRPHDDPTPRVPNVPITAARAARPGHGGALVWSCWFVPAGVATSGEGCGDQGVGSRPEAGDRGRAPFLTGGVRGAGGSDQDGAVDLAVGRG